MSRTDLTPPSFIPPTTVYQVQGMTCEHCQARVEGAAQAVPGVTAARVDLQNGTLTTFGGVPEDIITALAEAGYPAVRRGLAADQPEQPVPLSVPSLTQGAADYQLRIADMHCASCVSRVEAAISAVPGVVGAAVNLVDGCASVTGGDPEQVCQAVAKVGYQAQLLGPTRPYEESGYEVDVLGMHCAACVNRVEAAIRGVAGVTGVAVNLIEKKALVQGGDPHQVVQAVIDQGYGASLRQRPAADSFVLRLQPWPTAAEVEQMREILLAQDPGSTITVAEQELRVATGQHPADVLLRLADSGFQAELAEIFADPGQEQAQATRLEIRRSWQRALVAGVVGMGLMVGHMTHSLPPVAGHPWFWTGAAMLCLLTIFFSGRQYFQGAWKQARHGAANMDTLVALGTGAAWLASALTIIRPQIFVGAGEQIYLDASVMILAFLQLGHALEARAKRVTGEAIGALVGLKAHTARVVRATGQAEVPVSLLRLGDRVRVKPGEQVPIDGEIIEGRTTIDESMLTGEPLAVAREVGDSITGGTMNRSGTFVLRVTRLGEDTTLARIIRLVKTAQMSKPPIGRLADRIAGVFVPVVIAISLVSCLCWLFLAGDQPLAHGLTAAIAVLVIACPCALGLATPIAIMVGTSRAAQCNVLIRNSDALQAAATLTHVVVDKTGTLTVGRPTVTTVFPAAGSSEHEVLRWAASLESGSEHPLAEAVVTAHIERGGGLVRLANFAAIPGRGVRAEYDEVSYLLGNDHFLVEEGVMVPPHLQAEAELQAERGGTPVWLARNVEVMGLLVLKDPVRQDSAAAVRRLQQMGISVVMCSGDNRRTAGAVAREVGITEVHSEILPEEKLAVIQGLQGQGARVGMVGDGVNDAPALAQADTGFAIGSGTDVAIANADITLTGDSLLLVADAIAIAGATIRTIRQNLLGAFLYNVIGIPLAAGLFYPWTGWMLPPMFASAAMALSSVTVVTNANRLRYFRPR